MNKITPIFGISLLFISGCISLPWHLKPETRDPAATAICPAVFSETSGETDAGENWWKQFGEEELNSLVQTAFSDNLQVAAAWTRLRQAEAQAGIATSARMPQLSGTGEAETTRQYTKTSNRWERDETNHFRASLATSFEIDLWGRLKAKDSAALLTAEASREDVQTTGLMIAGEVTATWLQIRTRQMQLDLLNQQLKTNREALELLQLRQRKGMSNIVDVLQQQQQVAATESLIPPVEESLALLKQQLAILLGLPPTDCPELEHDPLPSLPAFPALGIPADVLAARPDVQAAWDRLEASEWDVTAARADRLPALRLTGSVSASSAEIEDLFDNWATNLVAALAGPIIDGGQRKAEVRRTRAIADEAVITYKQTVLTALKEIEEALISERYQQKYVKKLDAEAQLAAQTLDETRRRYRKGLSDYLPVLTALASKQQAERASVKVRGNLLVQRVSLYKALGGKMWKE